MYCLNVRLMEQLNKYNMKIDTYEIIRERPDQKIETKVINEYKIRKDYHRDIIFKSMEGFTVVIISRNFCTLSNSRQVEMHFYDAITGNEGFCLRNPYELV